ncbi:hypothetical protein LOD99_4843 [Oopsacas minuta]|uniref:Calponin-homology (CH) domain-containing protein n=1 Tax=Oopsacas minuta TaxID=111878 RepID=A0AAV7JS39_9METZ|nr:hypothetical protein LOD99_4843 [Oopsacas minuta]
MTSPTSWFGLRTKSSSKRSVSPVPVSASTLRSSMRSSRTQGAEDLARRGAYLHPIDSSKCQEQLVQTPRASETQGEAARYRSGEDVLRSNKEDLGKTYLSWVNAHLKKRNDSDKIIDLAAALQDGVTLLNLAEILSGREVTGSLRIPQTREDQEINVSRVLSFLLKEGLEVKSVSSSEIMKGNMKHILRVIYSMACHYKATPIQQPGLLGENRNGSLQSTPALNEYANLKHQVNEFEKKLRGNALIAKYRRMSINSNILSDVEDTAGGYETDGTVCDENHDHIPKPKSNNLEEPIYINMPLCQMPNPVSTNTNTYNSNNDYSNILRNSKSASDLISIQDTEFLNSVNNRMVHVYSESNSQQVMTLSPPVKQDDIEMCFDKLSVSLSELSPIKHQIMQVQNVLVGSTDIPGLKPDMNLLQSQLADVQMKLDDKICQLSENEEKREKISSQLNVVVQECTDLSNRLTESLSIRADVLRKDYLLQNSESENLSLRIAVREKDEIIRQLNGRLLLREELLSTLESQVNQ